MAKIFREAFTYLTFFSCNLWRVIKAKQREENPLVVFVPLAVPFCGPDADLYIPYQAALSRSFWLTLANGNTSIGIGYRQILNAYIVIFLLGHVFKSY